MEEELFLVGVYDHLRRGGEAHDQYLYGSVYKGTYYTEPEYDLYSLQAQFPGLKTGGSTSILLEIFEVDARCLKTADYFEGTDVYNPYNNVFDRIEIETPFGPCFVYEYSKPIMGKPIIESGDWFKHKQLMREKMSKLNNEEGSRWGIE